LRVDEEEERGGGRGSYNVFFFLTATISPAGGGKGLPLYFPERREEGSLPHLELFHFRHEGEKKKQERERGDKHRIRPPSRPRVRKTILSSSCAEAIQRALYFPRARKGRASPEKSGGDGRRESI